MFNHDADSVCDCGEQQQWAAKVRGIPLGRDNWVCEEKQGLLRGRLLSINKKLLMCTVYTRIGNAIECTENKANKKKNNCKKLQQKTKTQNFQIYIGCQNMRSILHPGNIQCNGYEIFRISGVTTGGCSELVKAKNQMHFY